MVLAKGADVRWKQIEDVNLKTLEAASSNKKIGNTSRVGYSKIPQMGNSGRTNRVGSFLDKMTTQVDSTISESESLRGLRQSQKRTPEHNEKKEIHMRYRLLGNSGLRVSEAALGTMTFGDDWGWGAAKDESRKVYDAFREAGGNFIDTANVYTNGTSELLLGEFMKDHRQSVVLATKYTNAVAGTDPNAAGNHRKSMVQALEASLKRLKTDYIDLYWVHIWDQITPVEEVMRGLDDLVRQGEVLYLGISDAPAWWIAQANTLAHLRGWSPFIGLQIEYSLIERTVERELIPMAKALKPRLDRVVATVQGRADRQVPRSRVV